MSFPSRILSAGLHNTVLLPQRIQINPSILGKFQTSRHLASAAGLAPASAVKKLRDITGSSIGNCRKALLESNADLDAALNWLLYFP